MESLEELREKVLPVLIPWGIRRVAIFGSVVRGEDTEDSDVDTLVELREPPNRPSIGLKWFGLEEELSRILGRDVELVSAHALSPYVRPHVEADMVVLYDEG
jgi:predicted nucleotidyltransferase